MTTEFCRIAVLGLGYVGLPLALSFAGRGLEVVGVDINPGLVATLAAATCPISEPGLAELLRATLADGHFKATSDIAPADAYIIAVPTPCRSDRTPDLDSVLTAARTIAPHLKVGDLVVIESTCPVGTTMRVCEVIAGLRPDLNLPHRFPMSADIHVCYCPERVLPGQTLHELVQSDRVVGGISLQCAQKAKDLYRRISVGRIQETSAETAEMVKLVENAYRDVNIAFANEVANMSDAFGLNVHEVIGYANRHRRVQILTPGPGVGGHCIPVDPWFLISSLPGEAHLMTAARHVNDHRPSRVVRRVLKLIDECPEARVVCYGLAYKPNVGDVRESPAVKIIKAVAELRRSEILVFDPHVSGLPQELTGVERITLSRQFPDVAPNDIILLLVAHREFENMELTHVPGDRICDEVSVLRLPSRLEHREPGDPS